MFTDSQSILGVVYVVKYRGFCLTMDTMDGRI